MASGKRIPTSLRQTKGSPFPDIAPHRYRTASGTFDRAMRKPDAPDTGGHGRPWTDPLTGPAGRSQVGTMDDTDRVNDRGCVPTPTMEPDHQVRTLLELDRERVLVGGPSARGPGDVVADEDVVAVEIDVEHPAVAPRRTRRFGEAERDLVRPAGQVVQAVRRHPLA